MNNETKERAARSLLHVQCIGSPGHKEHCYFPKAYVVENRHTFFKHIAEQNCIEFGLSEDDIEIMTIQEAWQILRHKEMPEEEQAKINYGIEDQNVDTNISQNMYEQWAEEREARKNVKLQISEEEEES